MCIIVYFSCEALLSLRLCPPSFPWRQSQGVFNPGDNKSFYVFNQEHCQKNESKHFNVSYRVTTSGWWSLNLTEQSCSGHELLGIGLLQEAADGV